MPIDFLPATKKEMLARGWDFVDVVLVTGDAYVDHPSFGVALIGRWLEAHGYRVAVLSQPRHETAEDFTTFGRPRLFFGITAGNLDSIVANYSGNARVRDEDSYSPAGNPYFDKDKSKANRRRPDRATIKYTNLARSVYKDVPIVLGGLEASLRRFVHYDFQQEKLRASVLTDAKGDLLVYGMGERAVLEIARRLDKKMDLANIPGTCERLTDTQLQHRISVQNPINLPAWQQIHTDKKHFMDAELAVDKHARAVSEAPIIQKQQALWVYQNKPSAPLTSEELDELYGLPYTREPYPDAGDVPAHRMIKDSVTIVRGCCGNCSFCSISRHQGAIVTSRSIQSVLREVKTIGNSETFRGTISDLGGPTANLYGTSCSSPKPCKKHDCLYPGICRHLHIDERRFLDLLHAVEQIDEIKHLYISSGLRMELLLRTPTLLAEIIAKHTPGAMKVAPEHTDKDVLRLMHKPGSEVFQAFVQQYRQIVAQKKAKGGINPYIIASHPGCTEGHMRFLAEEFKKLSIKVRQFQDFTPTPGTISTAMYVTGLDRDTMHPIYVAKNRSQRKKQREFVESVTPQQSPKMKRTPRRAPFKKSK